VQLLVAGAVPLGELDQLGQDIAATAARSSVSLPG